MSKFVSKQSVSIFRATAHALHLTGFEKNSKNAEFFASLPFLTYLRYKGLTPSTHCVQLRRKNSKDRAGIEQIK